MPQNEITCQHCGFTFRRDQTGRCWHCDGVMCIYCLTDPPSPLCPDCRDNLPEVDPMLAENSAIPSEAGEWAFEFKWDGIRAIFYWNTERQRILSRNMLDITSRYPELADLGESFGSSKVILDGEILALDEKGRPDFKGLQKRMHLSNHKVARAAARIPTYYYIFDILLLDDRSLVNEPYSERRRILEQLNIDHRRCRVPPSFTGPGIAEDVLAAAKEHGLEGIMAKRLDSEYRPGQRCEFWRKIKIVKSQEFVIGGWLPQKNSDKRVGSLLLGYYDNEMRLRYAGNVGSGFTDTDHELLLEKLKGLEVARNPFAQRTGKRDARYIEPALVADIEYRRWPADGNVQQAAYKGLRKDKDPHQVFREENI